jgi:TRAP-type uncharacterized transport system fused permease subunit
MFVYEPMLLLIVNDWAGQWAFVVWSVISASIGVVCLSASLFGWLFGAAAAWHRVLLFVAALCLIKPGLYTDAAGLALLAIVGGAQLLAQRRTAQAI